MRHKNITYPKMFYPNSLLITVTRFVFFFILENCPKHGVFVGAA